MKRGFSLVELSIVLVILGLLVGGILAGQSLIRAAELRAVSTEYQRYVTAMRTFRDKYFALPGDMANATKFWGAAGTCPGTTAAPFTGTATCDGNGDGIISVMYTTPYGEMFTFWQQLANAGLIEGSYSGVTNSSNNADVITLIGTNVPRSKISSAGWTEHTFLATVPISNYNFFPGDYTNGFYFGAQSSNNITQFPILKPEEAWNIDTKLDDGKPGTGLVRTREDSGPNNCVDIAASTTVDTSGTAQYYLTNTSIACMLLFKTQ